MKRNWYLCSVQSMDFLLSCILDGTSEINLYLNLHVFHTCSVMKNIEFFVPQTKITVF